MKRMFVGLAAVILTTSAALAAGRFADTSVGKVYVNDRGLTLYTLSRDGPNFSTCYGKCARIWPPYLVTTGAKYKRGWSIVVRQDGTRMWAYRGHPVYAFFKDRRPGNAYGEGIRDEWGAWHVAAVGGSYVSKPVASYRSKRSAGGAYGGSSGSSGGMSGY